MSKQTTKSEGKRSRVTITGSGNAVSTGKLCAPLKEIKKRRVEGGEKKEENEDIMRFLVHESQQVDNLLVYRRYIFI